MQVGYEKSRFLNGTTRRITYTNSLWPPCIIFEISEILDLPDVDEKFDNDTIQERDGRTDTA